MAICLKKIECPSCHKVEARVGLHWTMQRHFIPKFLPASRIECEMSRKDPRCPECRHFIGTNASGKLNEHGINGVHCPGSGLQLFGNADKEAHRG